MFSEHFSGKKAIKFQVAFWPSWILDAFFQKPDHHVLR